jgi:Na+/H+-dicarboxylate symporter
MNNNWFKNYSSIIWLLAGIIAGTIAGIVLGKGAEVLKPIGDLFLNLLFVAVIPLVFFAISSAIANLQGTQKLSRIMGIMTGVFLGMILVAAILTITALWIFPLDNSMAKAAADVSQDAGKNSRAILSCNCSPRANSLIYFPAKTCWP